MTDICRYTSLWFLGIWCLPIMRLVTDCQVDMESRPNARLTGNLDLALMFGIDTVNNR